MLKKMGDLRLCQFRQIARRLHVAVNRREFIYRYGQQFFVGTCLVGHLQHADRPTTHHDAWNQRIWRHHQHIDGIAVAGKRPWNVAVVAGVMHRRRHEAVDEQSTGRLVQFILDRVTVHRDFDNDIHIIWHIAASINAIKIHGGFSKVKNWFRL